MFKLSNILKNMANSVFGPMFTHLIVPDWRGDPSVCVSLHYNVTWNYSCTS